MVSLTIQQRDLLHHLLAAEKPVVVADIANRMNLTPRQVSYRLKPLKVWLSQREATLKATPGIGITIDCPSEQRFNLLHELNSQVNFQLILTPGQRQQLFAFTLLTTKEPLILDGLGYIASISRTTVLKDLDVIEEWLQVFALTLIRRPNFGLLLEGPELAQRQALVSLLWEDVFFEDSLIKMTYDQGLIFSFSDNTALPILKQTNALLKDWNTPAALEWVTYAEAQLGGRFTDDAVLHLALAFLIQRHRVAQGQYIQSNPKGLSWLVNQKVWPVALEIAYIGRMGPNITEEEFQPEVAYIAMHLLAGLRDHMWPGDLDIDPNLTELITLLMEEVTLAFNTPGLRQDMSLRDGLVAHIIPAVMRQRFGLWFPPSWSDGALSRKYEHEYTIARELALLVSERTSVTLPDGEIDTLTLLLRAAFIRERPHRPKRAFIICPSGMATSQLLVARLKARFPSLEILGVLSLRELTSERVAGAQLLISTVPLLQPPKPGLPVIQVHPLLPPEDIETITHWLT